MRHISVDEVIEFLPDVVAKLRSMGYTVGTSQAVEAARILESYAMLRKARRIDEQEAVMVLESVLSARGISHEDVSDALRQALAGRRVKERAEKIMSEIEERIKILNTKPGLRVSKKGGRTKREKRERARAYLDLKRIGAIRGKGGSERIADAATLHSIAWRLAREGYESLEEAARGVEGLNKDQMLMAAEARAEVGRDSIARAENWRLLRLGEAAARKGNYRLLRIVAEEVSRRVLAGYRMDPGQARFILEKAGLLTPDHEKMLYITGNTRSIDPGKVDVDTLANAVNSMGDEEAASLIAKALKRLEPGKARRLLERVEPGLLWQVRRTQLSGREASLVKAVSMAASAVREAMLYAETGDPARADMAQDYLSRAESLLEGLDGVEVGGLSASSAEDLAEAARAILGIASLDHPSPGELARTLSLLGFERAVRILRGLYRGGGEEWRRMAEWALERIIYMAASREGLRPLPKWRYTTTGPGRLDVRRSLYRRLRLSQDPLVYRRRLRSNLVSMALDVSGSMQSYSIWALGMASMFARSLDRVVLFSSSVDVYQGPFGRRDIARLLLSVRFKGYTDIYTGILEAARARAKRVVVITDLAQTIDRGDPLEAALAASRAGKKLVFIVPLRHDEQLRSRLEDAGFSVVIVSEPRQAARQVLRAFSR